MTYRSFSSLSVGVLVAVAACAENPAEPPDPVDGDPEATINPVPDPWTSCYPIDVVSERTVSPVNGDTTQTVYTGFEGCGPGIPGQFDMWLYGIEIQDLTNEAPYGDTRLELDNRASWVLNAPSGGTVAIQKSHAPPIGFVEFEPFVREITFFYSVRWPARAYWDNQIVGSDSVEVRAIGSGGIIWDRVTLHANSPDYPAPYQVWNTVTLTGPPSSIKYLEVRGQMAIDDLEIVSGPRPQVKCTSVTRGGSVRCQVDPAGKTAVRWHFQPDGNLQPVDLVTSDEVWEGPGVASGTVSVELSDGSTPSGRLEIQDRPSQWQAHWDYQFDNLLQLPNTPIDPSGPNPITFLGRNCDRQTLCGTVQRRVTPDPAIFPLMGASPDSVETGPNAGYWWVGTISYNMFREAALLPATAPTSTVRHPVPGASNSCRSALGTPPGVVAQANWYEYNLHCTKGKSYMVDLYSALIAHEGFGIPPGEGHESAARAHASLPDMDPWIAVDTLVRNDSAGLDFAILLEAGFITNQVDLAAKHIVDGGNTGGNWSGKWRYYSASAGAWAIITNTANY